MKHFSVIRRCDNRRKTKEKKKRWRRKVKKIASRDQVNDRGRRMNIRGGEEKDSLLGSSGIGETLDYENVPTPTSKVLFSFSYVPLFSLPRPSRHRCRPDPSFSPSRYLRLIPCTRPSFLVHLRASVERSQFITVSRIRFQGRRNRVRQAPRPRVTRIN